MRAQKISVKACVQADVQGLVIRFAEDVEAGAPASFKTFKAAWQATRFSYVFEEVRIYDCGSSGNMLAAWLHLQLL